MKREHAQQILEKIISFSAADETFASLNETNDSFQPFAANELRPAGMRHQTMCTITVRVGKQFGTFTTNRMSDASLKSAIANAVGIAKLLPPVENHLPFLGTQQITEASLFKQSNDSIPASSKIGWVKQCIDLAKSNDSSVSGTITSADASTALISSRGLFAYQPSSNVYIRVRSLSRDGRSSGYAERWNYDFNKIDVNTIVKIAIDLCTAGKNQKDIKPGKYNVILSPAVVADFLYLLLQQFRQSEIDEKRSFLTKMGGGSQVGAKLFPSFITIFSDPYFKELPSFPFTSDGETIGLQTWIRDGVINQTMKSRNTNSSSIPFPSNIIFSGGEKTLDRIIAQTTKAILINSVSNLRITDVTNCLLSGVTRDGLMMIEDGKITSGLKNMRFSETPVYMLKATDELSVSEQISGRRSMFPMLGPAIKMIGFNFTSQTDLI